MVETYWNIGRIIVEEEQDGKARAEYGHSLIPRLSDRLTEALGKGFSEQSLWDFRLLFQTFPELAALPQELSWSHYRLLMRVEDPDARSYYLQEANSQNWSVRALKRQINTQYFYRLLTSQDKKSVREEAAGEPNRKEVNSGEL